MLTTTEPQTGAVASIIDKASRLGEDWRAPRETPASSDYRPTIPPREPRSTWLVGDVVVIGRTRWRFTMIDGQAVVLTSMNLVASAVTWTTTLGALPERSN